jgi:hypothetical protein
LGIATNSGLFARVCESAGRLDEARDLLSRANLMSDDRYKDLVLRLSVYPDNLLQLSTQRAVDTILNAYRGNPDIKLNAEQAGIVFDCLVEKKDISAAVRLGWEYALSSRLGALMQGDVLIDGIREATCHGLVRGMLREKDWQCLGHLLGPRSGSAAVFRTRFPHVTNSDFEQMRLLLTREWARAGDITAVPANLQTPLQKFLKGFGERFVINGKMKSLSFEEVSAAIERGGRYNDAREFYSSIRTPPCPEKLKDAAKIRLIAAKCRYLRELLPRGETGTTRQLQREIQHALAAARLKSAEDIPSYPPVEPLLFDGFVTKVGNTSAGDDRSNETDATVKQRQLSDRVVFQTGGFEFVYSRTSQRLNITNASLETAHFLVDRRSAGGEKVFTQVDDSFECREWGLRLRILDHNGISKLEIQMENAGVVLILETSGQLIEE